MQKSYDEVLEFIHLPGGFQVIVPSPLDLASARLSVDELKQLLGFHDTQPLPPELKAAKDTLERASEEVRAATLRRLEAWENERIGTRQQLQVRLHQKQRQLAALEAAEVLDGGERTYEVHVLRSYGHGEVLEIEDDPDVSELNDETWEKKVNYAELNRRLFKLVYQGTKEGATVDPRTLKVTGGTFVPLGAVEAGGESVPRNILQELEDGKTTILMDRMLARNRMSPVLAAYFRERRDGAGG